MTWERWREKGGGTFILFGELCSPSSPYLLKKYVDLCDSTLWNQIQHIKTGFYDQFTGHASSKFTGPPSSTPPPPTCLGCMVRTHHSAKRLTRFCDIQEGPEYDIVGELAFSLLSQSVGSLKLTRMLYST